MASRWILSAAALAAVGTACGSSAKGGAPGNAAGGGDVNDGTAGGLGSLAGAASVGSAGADAAGATFGGAAGAIGAGGASAGGAAGVSGVSGSLSSVGGSLSYGQGGLTGGAGVSIASAGTGGAPPLDDIGSQQKSAKLDVLFVVDNSANLADKQAVLGASVPAFVNRLVNPRCVDAQGVATAQPASGAAACASGTREFTPITDMHLGVITTSIGNHGGNVCSSSTDPEAHLDDRAQLIPSMRTGVASYQDSGFMSWDSAGKTGVADASAVSAGVTAMITAAGQNGCGFEAPLEAMYRFLVDPEPPISIVEGSDGWGTSTGTNAELLKQRAAFLRPDSAVAIVILTDENDCSIQDTGVGWFVGSTLRMPRATAACATNPNDACCRSCAQNELSPPPGCASLAQDPVCGTVPGGQQYATWASAGDSLNLRCYDQKGRFGFDLLNPVSRYVVGLTNAQVTNRSGTLVDNPLFAARDGKGKRSASLVSVSVIVGAPWQDLATTASLSAPTSLAFLDAAALESQNRWPMLVGDYAANSPPSDAFMVEAINSRAGTNPPTSLTIQPATSMNPQASPINGHEKNNDTYQDDLQFACTFPLAPAHACVASSNCPCSADHLGNFDAVTMENSPLCQPPGGGAPGTTQYYAGAYPGTRELVFARALAERAAPASICPKVNTTSSQYYGYQPALNALVDRVAVSLQ